SCWFLEVRIVDPLSHSHWNDKLASFNGDVCPPGYPTAVVSSEALEAERQAVHRSEDPEADGRAEAKVRLGHLAVLFIDPDGTHHPIEKSIRQSVHRRRRSVWT